MLDRIKTENILFIDIETVSNVQEYGDLDDRLKELWAKKIHWKAEKEQKTPQEYFEKAAIWSEFGKIVCISAGYLSGKGAEKTFRLKSFYGHSEKGILQNFGLLLQNHFNKDKHYLCAHNGKEFDFPYIARRMLINGIKPPKLLNMAGKKPWEIKHLDTMELWRFGDYKNYTSLDLLAAVFNIPSPKNEIAGSMVNKVYWEQNDLNKISAYCQRDVITICKLFLKYKVDDSANDLKVDVIDPSISN